MAENETIPEEQEITNKIFEMAGIEPEADKPTEKAAEPPENEAEPTEPTEPEVKPAQKSEAETAIEEVAKELGWIPQERFNDDGGRREYVDAKTYIKNMHQVAETSKAERKQLIRDMKEIKKKLNDFDKSQQNVRKADYTKQIETLKEERRNLIKEGDVEGTEAIDEKIREVEKNITTVETPPAVTDPQEIIVEWQDTNKWYNNDMAMTRFADMVAERYKTNGGRDTEEMLEVVNAEIEKYFPDRGNGKKEAVPEGKTKITDNDKVVDDKTKKQQPRVDAVGSTVNQNAHKSTRTKTYNDLTREQKNACDRFVNMGVISQEEYVKELVAQGEI
ncbi:MAG: hypothetical protein ABIG30_00815 [Candidatus Aenigmatarchaeota archaeon]